MAGNVQVQAATTTVLLQPAGGEVGVTGATTTVLLQPAGGEVAVTGATTTVLLSDNPIFDPPSTGNDGVFVLGLPMPS